MVRERTSAHGHVLGPAGHAAGVARGDGAEVVRDAGCTVQLGGDGASACHGGRGSYARLSDASNFGTTHRNTVERL
jgi:hypothetical protein